MASTATTALILTPIVAWVVGGAEFVLHQTVHVVAQTTAPQLTTPWFSSTYWRVAGMSAVLTLPFLFAAAVQALVRSDLGLLLRAALGYLPLAMLAVAIAAPLTMLFLAASDQLSAIVSSAAGNQSVQFLERATTVLGGVAATATSPFVVFMVALLTVGGAVALWIELMLREAAVYVIVLMLPLAFAAFVWPARRVWAVRSIELLIALILSKFAIVAVLALGGAALGHATSGSVPALLAGGVLIALAVLAPWAMLRLIPLTEIASAAAGSLSGGSQAMLRHLQRSDAWASEGAHWAAKIAQMRHAADEAEDPVGGRAVKENADANAGAKGSPPGPSDDQSAELGGAAEGGDDAAAANGATPPAGSTDTGAAAATVEADRLGAALATGPAPSNGEGARAEAIEQAGLAQWGAAPPPIGKGPGREFPASVAFDLENPLSASVDCRDQGGGGAEITDRTPPPQPPVEESEP